MDDLSIETVFFMIAMLIYERVRYIYIYTYIEIGYPPLYRYAKQFQTYIYIYIQ